jgi:hypothetical protein
MSVAYPTVHDEPAAIHNSSGCPREGGKRQICSPPEIFLKTPWKHWNRHEREQRYGARGIGPFSLPGATGHYFTSRGVAL